MKCVGFGDGFLLKEIVKQAKNRDFLFVTNNLKLLLKFCKESQIDEFWHFACPAGNFENEYSKIYKTFRDTHKIIKFCNKHNIRLIYAGSMGENDCECLDIYQKFYNCSKYVNTFMIQKESENCLCLIIPRVYGKDRDKGLIKKLKDNTFNGSKTSRVEFIDLNDFVSQTLKRIDEVSNTEIYYTTETATIEKIEERYLCS
jgi:nucleoside-diphosphate-sugar epimerase